jgi:epoxide hydrolase
MNRLGYERYGAQGGDTGALVSPQLGRIDAGHVVGVHVSNLLTFPSGQPGEPGDLSDTEQKRLELVTLRSAERDGLIFRRLDSERADRTTRYELADLGKSLDEPLAVFERWVDASWHLVEAARRNWADRNRELVMCRGPFSGIAEGTLK